MKWSRGEWMRVITISINSGVHCGDATLSILTTLWGCTGQVRYLFWSTPRDIDARTLCIIFANPMTTRRKLELTSPPKHMRPNHIIVQYARDNPHRFDDELLRQLKFFTREKVAYIILSGFIFSFLLWCICFCYLKSWQNFLQSLVQEIKQESNIINNHVEIHNNEICYYV